MGILFESGYGVAPRVSVGVVPRIVSAVKPWALIRSAQAATLRTEGQNTITRLCRLSAVMVVLVIACCHASSSPIRFRSSFE